MLIALDIGNTAVTYGISEKGRLKSFGSCLFFDIPKLIKICSRGGKTNEINVIISSVVPKNTHKIESILRNKKRIHLWIAGKNLSVPVKTKYHPNQLGVDRLVNAYGGIRLYRLPLLIIDFGTAITFDYVSKSGVFEGGMIVPGPELSFQALIQKAALLPKKARLPHKSPSFLGRSTLDCLKSGILEGYGSMTDELVARFKKRFGANLKVIATGGFAKHLKPHIQSVDRIEPKLSIKSLLLLSKTLPTKL
ncbi:MAG: type III pantothenate kinase [Candidatus Omnitrophica bacterium]|nr:type III pantothenate kinase [Candidatus Omnitrophota bacterium]